MHSLVVEQVGLKQQPIYATQDILSEETYCSAFTHSFIHRNVNYMQPQQEKKKKNTKILN